MSNVGRVHRLGLLGLLMVGVVAGGSLTPVGTAIAKEVTEVLVTNPVPAPIQGYKQVQLNYLDTNPWCEVAYTVPLGQRLTVEFASALVGGLEPGNEAAVHLAILKPGEFSDELLAVVEIPLVPAERGGPVISGSEAFAGSQVVQFFVDAGNHFSFCAWTEESEDGYTHLFWSGHIEGTAITREGP